MAETARERIVRYLQDAHAAEIGIASMLDGFIDDTGDTEIRVVLQDHKLQTQSQALRLETRIRQLGAEPSSGKGFLNSMMARISEVIHGAHDEFDKATQNLIKAYATEHLERGMYESLIAYASAVEDNETAGLAREIQQEEEEAAEKLFPLIEHYARVTVNASDGAPRAYTV